MLLAIGGAAVIFLPRHLASVGAEILAADVVVLADFSAAQASEVAFRYYVAPATRSRKP